MTKKINSTSINNFFKLLFSPPKINKRTLPPVDLEKEPKSRKTVFLDYGNKLIIPVYGEQYGQSHRQTALRQLYKKHGEKVIEFSLAPQSVYQEAMGWPEKPFLNVLPRGNIRVEKSNWLGYISPLEPDVKDDEHKDRLEYTKKIILIGEKVPLVVKGKIIKEYKEYSIILFASHKEIDENLEKLGIKA